MAWTSRSEGPIGLDQAQVDADLARLDVRQKGDETSRRAHSEWAKLKADASAKMAEIRNRIQQREAEHDVKVAIRHADEAEADAGEAIDFATWAADNARLAVLDAIDARRYADELAATTPVH